MKIIFDDKSSVECYKSNTPGKIIIAITAKDQANPLKKICNSCEIAVEEFKKLSDEVLT